MPGVPLPRLLSPKEEDELMWARYTVARAARRQKGEDVGEDEGELCEEVVDLSMQTVERLEAKQQKLLEEKKEEENMAKLPSNIYLRQAKKEALRPA